MNQRAAEPGGFVRRTWKRFLDHVSVYRSKSIVRLHRFQDLFNKLYPYVEFNLECSKQEMLLLNVLVICRGIKIVTNIYYKPKDAVLSERSLWNDS